MKYDVYTQNPNTQKKLELKRKNHGVWTNVIFSNEYIICTQVDFLELLFGSVRMKHEDDFLK